MWIPSMLYYGLTPHLLRISCDPTSPDVLIRHEFPINATRVSDSGAENSRGHSSY